MKKSDRDRDLGTWWTAEEGKVHQRLLPTVQAIDQRQLDHFDRFALLDALYDPNCAAASSTSATWRAEIRRMTENLIASNVDTVQSQVAVTEVRSRFLTDGASWSVARRAVDTEAYAEEMAKRYKRAEAANVMFFDATLKGTGLAKVFADEDFQIHVEPMLIDNVVVDDAECFNGAAPRSLHYRQLDRDRDQLIQQFPDFKAEINKAKGRYAWGARLARWRGDPLVYETRNDVFCVESWRLPMGVEGTEGYVPGLHAIVIDGCDLLVEPWKKPRFPIVELRWQRRRSSFYGISLAERIIGWQRVINKRGWHIEKVLDQLAMPTTYGSMADGNIRVQETEVGRWIALKSGTPPTTVVPQVIGPELQADRAYARDGSFRETGVSQMAATSTKPAGLEAGVALREWRDMGTDRFSMQEAAYERVNLNLDLAILDVCKDLGSKAPTMSKRSRWAPRVLTWDDVDYTDMEVQISAASTLPRTSAGREQTVMEFTQAGIFTLDEARTLLKHPDVDKILSLYTAVREAIEMDLEGIEEGHVVVPESFLNLDMAGKLAHARYLVDRQYEDCPEWVLDGLRDYIVRAKAIAAMAGPAPGAANLLPMPSTDPALLPPGAPPGMPGAPPQIQPQQVPSSGPPLTTQPAPALPPMA